MFQRPYARTRQKGEKVGSVLWLVLVSLLRDIAGGATKRKEKKARQSQRARCSAEEVQALRNALAAQQQQLETLEQQLDQPN